jgi:acetoin utilization deacetylase AcuC-like enzyme
MMREWKRACRRFWFQRTAAGLPVVYDVSYQKHVAGMPFDPRRGEKIVTALEMEGTLTRRNFSAPRAASVENLLRVHTPEYLHRLQEEGALTRILGAEIGGREAEAVLDLQRLMVGGTIQATRLALRSGGPAVHLGGGFHHALPDRGLGFCVFNDVAVAIARLRARGYEEKVLVVDLDLHDGNGTRAIFARDESVHTYSVHGEHWGETDAVESTSIALGPGVEDGLYLDTLDRTLPPLFESFRPGLVVYLAGTDPVAGDAIGHWRISGAALFARDRLVTTLTRRGKAIPLVVVLAGGYGPSAWRYTARYLLWLATGRLLEPPEDEDVTLRRIHDLALWAALPPTAADPGFTLSAQDLIGIDPSLGPPVRYLGLLSRQALELRLERLGILGHLRSRGFRRVRVDLDTDETLGHTLLVVSEGPPEERLVELRVKRSLTAVPDLEVLAVEWLLLQNPRASFREGRGPLPGQQYPGLGLLKEVLAFLYVLCEEHGLDGVYFVAAHYHVAARTRQRVRFLQPEDEARTLAFAEAMEGLMLTEQVAALQEGRLRSAETGEPVAWEPASMVLPVSEKLRARVTGPAYEEQVQAGRSRFSFVLRPPEPFT